MADTYAEVIVHDEKNKQGKQFTICMALLTVLLIYVGLMYLPPVLILGIVMLPVTFQSMRNRYREYEYLLVSDELEISVVKNRKKRKKLKTFKLNELQCMAPVKSHRLDYYHSNPQLKVLDYSSGNEEHDIYGMVFASDGALQEIKVEPNEAMLNEVKRHYASMVFSD